MNGLERFSTSIGRGTSRGGSTAANPDAFGPFGLSAAKQYSVTRISLDGTSLLKRYRGVEPLARRDREVQALHVAGSEGLSTPTVRGTGEGENSAWAVISVVSGQPCSVASPSDVRAFIREVTDLRARLDEIPCPSMAGSGWHQDPADSETTASEYLLAQLSSSCHHKLWWPDLQALLRPLDWEPVVHLHGDIKPEHLLVQEANTYIVDWEACGRGPAGCDFADAVFHAVRDLIYADTPPSEIPDSVLAELHTAPPLLAWRVIRWLDRRGADDLDALSLPDVYRLANAPTPESAVQRLTRLVASLHDLGVPR